MQIPEWTTPAIVGAGVGAIALSIIGFGWGGWMTEKTAQRISNNNSIEAVTMALMPYCLQNSKDDPNSMEVLIQLKKFNSYKQRSIIEEAGWATPLGSEKPNSALAAACQLALAAKT